MSLYPAAAGAFFLVFFIALVIALVPYIIYLLTLQKTLDLVSPDLRRMSSGQVWLMLIPLFSTIWNFMMVGYIADSLAGEFRRRNIPTTEQRPSFQLGQTMAILGACSLVPYLGLLASIAHLVLWIMYWVKISEYKRQLEQTGSSFGNPTNYGQQNYPPNYGQQNYPPNYGQQNYPPNYGQQNYPPNNP